MILTLLNGHGAFNPEDAKVLASAFDTVCRALDVPATANRDRAVVAERVIELARSGERDVKRICERILKEAGMPL
jgi:hypothetical protein